MAEICPRCSSEVQDGDQPCSNCGKGSHGIISMNGTSDQALDHDDRPASAQRRCLGCGAMHYNDDFKCDDCLRKENWKPEDWEAYRAASLDHELKHLPQRSRLIVIGSASVAFIVVITSIIHGWKSSSPQVVYGPLAVASTTSGADAPNVMRPSTQVAPATGYSAQPATPEFVNAQNNAYVAFQSQGIDRSVADQYASQVESSGVSAIDSYKYVNCMANAASNSATNISSVAPTFFGALKYSRGDLDRALEIDAVCDKYESAYPGVGVWSVAATASRADPSYEAQLENARMALNGAIARSNGSDNVFQSEATSDLETAITSLYYGATH